MTKRQHLHLLKPYSEIQPYPIKNAQQSQVGFTIIMRTPSYVRLMTTRYTYDFNNLAIAVRMPYDRSKCVHLSLFLSQSYIYMKEKTCDATYDLSTITKS